MTEYIIGKNKLEFATENNNLIVKNLANNITMTIFNKALPESQSDIDEIINLFRSNLIE